MRLLLGDFAGRLSTGDLKSNIQRGRDWLVQITSKDFGYDALQWHEYLWETDTGGYRWRRRSREKWARHVQAGMSRPGWADAVRELEGDDT
jgi:hypothetical protein